MSNNARKAYMQRKYGAFYPTIETITAEPTSVVVVYGSTSNLPTPIVEFINNYVGFETNPNADCFNDGYCCDPMAPNPVPESDPFKPKDLDQYYELMDNLVDLVFELLGNVYCAADPDYVVGPGFPIDSPSHCVFNAVNVMGTWEHPNDIDPDLGCATTSSTNYYCGSSLRTNAPANKYAGHFWTAHCANPFGGSSNGNFGKLLAGSNSLMVYSH